MQTKLGWKVAVLAMTLVAGGCTGEASTGEPEGEPTPAEPDGAPEGGEPEAEPDAAPEGSFALQDPPAPGEAKLLVPNPDFTGPFDNFVTDFDFAPDGRLWMATGRGLTVLSGEEWTLYDEPANRLRSPRGPTFHNDGQFTLCGGGTCMEMDPADGTIKTPHTGDPAFGMGNAPSHMIKTADGDLFIGERESFDAPLKKLPGGDFSAGIEVIEHSFSPMSFQIRDRDERYFYGWVQDARNGFVDAPYYLLVFDTETESFIVEVEVPGSSGASVMLSANGPDDVYFLDAVALSHYDGSTVTRIATVEEIGPNNSCKGAARTPDGHVWFSMVNLNPPNYLVEYDGSTFVEHSLGDSILAADQKGTMVYGPDGLLYWGSGDGLVVYNPG